MLFHFPPIYLFRFPNFNLLTLSGKQNILWLLVYAWSLSSYMNTAISFKMYFMMDLLWKQSNPFPVSCCFAFAVFVKGKTTFHVTHNYDHCNCVEFTAIRQSAYVNSFIWTHLMSSQIFCLEGDTSLEISAAEKKPLRFTPPPAYAHTYGK